jgi:hypothetical protein
MDKMIAADQVTITVAPDGGHLEIRACELDPGCAWQRAAVHLSGSTETTL